MINSRKQKKKNLIGYFKKFNQYNTLGKTSKLATPASPQETLRCKFSYIPLVPFSEKKATVAVFGEHGESRKTFGFSTVPFSKKTGVSPFSEKKATVAVFGEHGESRKTFGFSTVPFSKKTGVSPFSEKKATAKKRNFRIRSMPLKNNESVIECRKKHSMEIQKNAHYYYYILCRRQIQLSSHIKLNKKHLLTSSEIEQKASHSFKDKEFMEKKILFSQTTKPVTSLMWTLLNKKSPFSKKTGEEPFVAETTFPRQKVKNSNKSITFEEHDTNEKKNGAKVPVFEENGGGTLFSGNVVSARKDKNQRFPNLKFDAKMKTGSVPINLKTESFFPYRKSFLCYWLLPFVGFVSSATLSLNPKATVAVLKENSEAHGNKLSAAEEKNLNTNEYLTDSFLFNSKKKNLTKPFKKSDFLKSNLLEPKTFIKKETSLIPLVSPVRENTYNEEAEGHRTLDHFLKMPFVSPFSLKKGTGPALESNKQSISNSYKYCLYYLECLENTLNKDIVVLTVPFSSSQAPVPKKTTKNGKTSGNNVSESEEKKYSSFSPDSETMSVFQRKTEISKKNLRFFFDMKKRDLSLLETPRQNTQLNSSNVFFKGHLEGKNGNIEKLKYNTGFYLTSFFNRMLLAKAGCGVKFLNSLERVNQVEPLKINLNVPSIYLYDTNAGKKNKFGDQNLLQASVATSNNFRTHSSLKKRICGTDTCSEQIFFSGLKYPQQGANFYQESPSNCLNQQSSFSLKTTKLAETLFPQQDLNSLDTHFKKTNPVTSFLRVSTLLDKYMVYKPVLSQLKKKNQGVNSDINLGLVNKLFSYYSNNLFDNTNLESLKLFNLPKFPLSARKVKILNDGSSPFESVKPMQVDSLYILFKKMSSFDDKKSKDWWGGSSRLDEGTWEKRKRINFLSPEENSQKELEFKNELHSGQNNSLLDLEKNNDTFSPNPKKLPLRGARSHKNSSSFCDKVFTKLSKEKLYKLILIDLADNFIVGNSGESLKSRVQLNNLHPRDISDDKENSPFPKKMGRDPFSKVAVFKEYGVPPPPFGGIETFDFSTGDAPRARPGSDGRRLNLTGSLVQFKHPLLMSNHIAYPVKVISLNAKNAFLYSNGLNTIETYKKNLIVPKKRSAESGEFFLDVKDGEKKNSSFKKPSLKKIIQSNMGQQTLIYQNQKNSDVKRPRPLAHSLSTSLFKDFLILNQINSHLKPINREFYMTNSLFHIKNDYLSKKPKSDGLRTKTKFFVLNIPRIIDKSVQKTSQYEKKKSFNESNKNDTFSPNPKKLPLRGARSHKNSKSFCDKVFLTHELSFKFSKKHQSDKKAKLLRTYFSIKKDSNLKQKFFSKSISLQASNVTDKKRMSSILDSSSKLKQKITINLMAKSLLLAGSSPKQVNEPNELKRTALINGLTEVSPFSKQKATEQTKKSPTKTSIKKTKILSNQFNLSIQQKMKEVEKRIISPRLLVNNRLFMNMNVETGTEDNLRHVAEGDGLRLSRTGKSSSKFSFLVKPKVSRPPEGETVSSKPATGYLNIKNMNGPNEQILRKRKSIQKKRRITKLKKETRRRKKRMRFYPRPLWLRYRFYSQFLINRHHSKSIFPFNNLIQHKVKKPLERNILNSRHFSMNRNSLFPYSAGNASIDISSSVMGELKTAFWKSYWLRSNLKPYLQKIKKSLRDMKESSPQIPVKSRVTLFPVNSFAQFAGNITDPFSSKKSMGQDELFPSNFFPQKKIDSYYKTAHYLAEYNKISGQRIRQFVSQIRENLTLNGNAKVRPSRILFQFTPYNKTSKMKGQGRHFLKRPTLRYDALSRLRLYWALSKGSSNLVISGSSGYPPSTNNLNPHVYNKRKQLWTTEKLRQQTKENKTKKISNDLKKKLQSFLNDTPYFMLQDHSSLIDAMLFKTLKKIRIQNEKLYSFSFVHNKQNNSSMTLSRSPVAFLESPFSSKTSTGGLRTPAKKKQFFTSRNENYDLRQFKMRHNRLKNSFTGTAKTHPFISAKTNYWWLQFKPTTMNGLGSSISNSINSGSSIQNIFGQNSFSSSFNKNKDIQKSLVRSKNNTYMNSSTIHKQSNESLFQINTLLFHFCSLITLLSISQIRGLLKFTFIGLNKVFTLFERLTPSSLYKPFFPQATPTGLAATNTTWPNFIQQNQVDDGRRTSPVVNRNFGLNRSSTNSFLQVPFSSKTVPFSSLKKTGEESRLLAKRSEKKENLQRKFSSATDKVFDLNKRNDSFLYFFYATPLEKNLVSSSISSPQKSLIQSFFKTSLKGSSSQQFSDAIEKEEFTKLPVIEENVELSRGNFVSATKGSRQLISTFNLRFLLTEGQFGLTDTLQNKSTGLNTNMTSYITGFYSLLNFSLKKPIVFFNKWFLRLTATGLDTKSIPTISKSTLNSFEKNQPISMKTSVAEMNNNVQSPDGVDTSAKEIALFKNKIVLYSLFGLKQILVSLLQVSQNVSTLLGQRAKLENGFRSIYMFFEKPGVLIVDWVAYLFLVEWASDITNTLPENVDAQIVGSPFKKLTRTIYSVSPLLPGSQFLFNSTLFRSLAIGTSGLNSDMNITSGIWSSDLISQIPFLNLASTFLKRRMYHLYEILVLQFYQPDTDLLVRQKKGIVFWDIWGDFLTQTAEDSNINISELTSLKEEQIKLLENASLEIKVPFSPKTGGVPPGGGGGTPFPSTQAPVAKKTSLSSITRFKDQISSKKMGGAARKTLSNISSFQPRSGINSLSSSFLGVPLEPRSQKQENRLHQWDSQQFLSYAIKSKDTELFIDLHPPRALSNLLKKKESSQQLRSISPLGSLVCQIFSGILTKQISKNILIIGNSSQKARKKENSLSGKDYGKTTNKASHDTLSLEKSLLVQAIAGETELKMITDNAYRYALVYRGVAVGIKLLRDVFDSLSLQTPCFFLIEDIHAIGERRPFLISDDSPEAGQNVEVHEKNQVLYQLSKHVMSHYKKPYKGDFSLSIPTNHFCFDFFKGRTSTTSKIGKASLSRQNTVSQKIPYTEISNGEQKKKGIAKVLKSRLNRSSVELLSPPATSPFSVLTLKEEKKFKTKKKVSDLSWSGKTSGILKGDNTNSQDSQKTGPAYSIRSKVALLADMAISSLSVKLDMITDLLVIIDSVKGNRGFVVFATTHIPFVLDPALRRPGRLDETIHFGFSSKNHAWEISRLGILNVPSSRSFESSHHSLLIDQIMRSPSALGKKSGSSLDFSLSSIDIDIHTLLARFAKSVRNKRPEESFLSPLALKIYSSQNTLPYSKRTSSLFSSFSNSLFQPNLRQNLTQLSQSSIPVTSQSSSATFGKKTSIREQLMDNSCLNYPRTSQILSQVATKASSYFNVSLRFFTGAFLKGTGTNEIQPSSSFESINKQNIQLSPHNNSQPSHFDLCINNELSQLSDFSPQNTFVNSSHLSLYGSSHMFKKNISFLISSKIGEFLLFSKNSKLPVFEENGVEPIISSDINSIMTGAETTRRVVSFDVGASSAQKNNSTRVKRRISLMPILNESISSLILSFVQKRFLYKKNLLLPSLFNLTNYSSLLEPSSPPISSILLPAKRYENLKRSLFYYQNNDQNFGGGIVEKINMHQQQRLIKRLYHIPVKESFRSEMIENRFSGFSNASLMIGSISPSRLHKTSTSNWFIRNRILTRHSNYLTNQWWTGQLPEHNSETTFLSDIDWRYTFLAADTFGEKEARDILLDFPDADQHYNPRNRRWIGNLDSGGIFGTIGIHSLTSSLSSASSAETKFPEGDASRAIPEGDGRLGLRPSPKATPFGGPPSLTGSSISTQTTTENSISTEIYTHFIYDSFLKAFNIYEQNREVFDYYVFYICKQGLHSNLNEFERLKLIQRFLNF